MRDFLGARWPEFLAALQAAARADAELAAFSANADCKFRLVAGARSADFSFESLSVSETPTGKPSFILEAPPDVWAKFFSFPPPAPFHGVYAMKCPLYRTLHRAIVLTSSVSLVSAATTS